MSKKSTNVYELTQLALLFALSVVLMILEGFIPPIPTLPPGVKMGLSNIIIMYCLFYIGNTQAFTLLILKSIFVLITRGITAFFLSFSGGLLSIIIIILILLLKKIKLSYIMISISGSIAHNVAQIVISSLLLESNAVYYYLPILIISGVLMGTITGIILKITIPAIKRLNIKQ